MMNRLYKIITAVLVICCLINLIGCEKFLDEKTSRKLAVPTTLGDFQALLDNVPKINQNSPSAGEISSDNYYLTDEKWESLADENERRKYTWEKDHLFANSFNEWDDIYQAIYFCNTVLSGVDKVKRTGSNATEWDNVKGQALYCRGNNYLDATVIWSEAYDKESAPSDLGLPLRLNTDFNEVSVRSSVQQTYAQIIQDVKGSIALLPLVPLSKFRPSKSAAYGLLARAYLSMRDYENAYKYADSCLSLNSNLLDYNTIDYGGIYPFTVANNTEVIYFRFMSSTDIIYDTTPIIIPEIYDSYALNDLRKQAFFEKNDEDETYYFKGGYGGGISLFCGIATNEIFLIKAECLARTGKVVESIDLLNSLVVKRWDKTKVYVPYTAANANEALHLVLKERRKELLMTGLRWMDIKRLNKEGANIMLTRTLHGQTYNLQPNDLRFALPIPEDVIATSGIIQNKR